MNSAMGGPVAGTSRAWQLFAQTPEGQASQAAGAEDRARMAEATRRQYLAENPGAQGPAPNPSYADQDDMNRERQSLASLRGDEQATRQFDLRDRKELSAVYPQQLQQGLGQGSANIEATKAGASATLTNAAANADRTRIDAWSKAPRRVWGVY